MTDTETETDQADTQPQYSEDDEQDDTQPQYSEDDDETQLECTNDVHALRSTALPTLVPQPTARQSSPTQPSPPQSPSLLQATRAAQPPRKRRRTGKRTTDWMSSRNVASWNVCNTRARYTSRAPVLLNTLFARWCTACGVSPTCVRCEVTQLATSKSERGKMVRDDETITVIRVSDKWLQQPHVSVDAVKQELLPHFATLRVGNRTDKGNGDRWLDTARRMGWEGVAHSRGGESFVAHAFACTIGTCAHTCHRREKNATCVRCGAKMRRL